MTEALGEKPKNLFPEAVKKITRLVGGDALGRALYGPLTPEKVNQRDQLWEEAAQEFSPFSEKIRGLREFLKIGYSTHDAYPKPAQIVMRLGFSAVEDELVGEVLRYLLWARLSRSPGYLDYSLDPSMEEYYMAQELGFKDGLKDDGMKKLTLERLVEAILLDELKLKAAQELNT